MFLIPKAFRKFRLRTVLIVPFVLPIVATTGLVGWFSFRNGQQAIDDLATQLNSEISSRIKQQVLDYLNKSQNVHQLTYAAVESGNLKLDDFEGLQRYFWQVVKKGDLESYLSYGNEQGEFVGVEHRENGTIQLKIRTKSTSPIREIYLLDSQGNRQKQLKGKEYDPRRRPWYKVAKQAGKPTWSPIYPFSSRQNTSLGISPVRPVYDSNGKLLGVLNINITLVRITDFLKKLYISPNGQSFIMDRSGDLIVSSKIPEPFTVKGKGEDREIDQMPAANSENPTVTATAKFLKEQFGNFAALDGSQNLKFPINGAWHYVEVLPIRDGRGIDWLAVVVVPEADFMGRIHANTRSTIILCLIALGVATAIGILTARWISELIFKLNSASRAFADGKLDRQVDLKGINELETLANSFNSMARQLQESFTALEVKNADLQQAKEALAAAKEQLEAVLNAVPGSISWIGSNGVYLGVNRYLSDSLNLLPEEIVGKELGFFENSPDFANFIQHFLASDSPSASQEIPIKINGQERYYLMAVQKYQQGTAIVTVGIDITERQQAEEALRIAEENYRSIFENALEGIFQATPDGQYISVNPALADIYGYSSPEETLAAVRDIGEQIYVERDSFAEYQRQIQERGEIKNWEYQAYRQDGSIVWVEEDTRVVKDSNGKLLYYEGIIQDITQRKQQEEEIKRQLAELQIGIDQQKLAKEVAQITQSDYFQELQAEAESLRFDDDW